MSGILGVVNRNGVPVDNRLLGRMMHALRHRGPDGAMRWVDGHVALGYQSLVTTPEEQSASQPATTRSGKHAIVADARLDNRDELLRALGVSKGSGSRFSDAEIILRSYEKWGAECPEHLLGAFAFAIWDASRQRLYCARDHFGVKPLYFHISPDLGIIASEIRGITVHPDVYVRLNEQWIADKLAYFSADTLHTAFQNVYRLPPGHWLTCTADDVTTRSYWSLESDGEMDLGSDHAYAEAFREVFMEAVDCRMRGEGPPGSMLSGGLDSSSVACAAQHVLEEDTSQIHTFSAVFDDVPESDERAYINEVLEAYPFIPHFIKGDDLNPLVTSSLVEGMGDGEDEPIRAPNLHINWYAYERAASTDVRFILDGFDGDTTISHGLGSFHEMAQRGAWGTFIREAWAYTSLRDQKARSLIAPFLERYILQNVRGYGRLRSWLQSVWNTETKDNPGEPNILRSDFADRIGWEERKRALSQNHSGLPITERELHRRLLVQGNMPAVLETLDRCAARFQVEVRYPFWDRRLIEFCLALPPNLKLHRGWSRRIMRIGLDSVLPKKIQWRVDKSDVSDGLVHALLKYSRSQIKEVVETPCFIHEYADKSILENAFERFAAGKPVARDTLHLWNAVTLELWLRSLYT